MHVEDLHHEELVELDPEGRMIRFAGQRARLLNAEAMGIPDVLTSSLIR